MAGKLKSDYWLASHNAPILGKSRMVVWTGGRGFKKYSYPTNAWVDDRELAGIFIGSPEVIPITEQQARETIERNGGTWTTPRD